MEEDFNFDNPKDLCDSFKERNTPSKDTFEINYNAFWHELGHLFGLILAEINNYKLATSEKIIIDNVDQKLCIKNDGFPLLLHPKAINPAAKKIK